MNSVQRKATTPRLYHPLMPGDTVMRIIDNTPHELARISADILTCEFCGKQALCLTIHAPSGTEVHICQTCIDAAFAFGG